LAKMSNVQNYERVQRSRVILRVSYKDLYQ